MRRNAHFRTRAGGLLLILLAGAGPVRAQVPEKFIQQSAPLRTTKVERLRFVNPFDGSVAEALLELPGELHSPAPLIVSPHPANWSAETNRSLWRGIAEGQQVFILHPIHQGKLAPGITFGSKKQMMLLESAIEAVKKGHPVDPNRVYAAGASQGAIEALLLAGRHPECLAGVLAINPLVDFLAYYQTPELPGDSPLTRTRSQQWQTVKSVIEKDFGGTPDTARGEYYLRSPILYAQNLARVPLILYWADNDEIIGHGLTHQGGLLAEVVRSFHPHSFYEVRHSGGHGYPFFQFNLSTGDVQVFAQDIFLESVKKLLTFNLGETHRAAAACASQVETHAAGLPVPRREFPQRVPTTANCCENQWESRATRDYAGPSEAPWYREVRVSLVPPKTEAKK